MDFLASWRFDLLGVLRFTTEAQRAQRRITSNLSRRQQRKQSKVNDIILVSAASAISCEKIRFVSVPLWFKF
jgi:hypothetical protein